MSSQIYPKGSFVAFSVAPEPAGSLLSLSRPVDMSISGFTRLAFLLELE